MKRLGCFILAFSVPNLRRLEWKRYNFEFRFTIRLINDDYPKYIITMDELPMGEDGIRQINVIDFLLQNK